MFDLRRRRRWAAADGRVAAEQDYRAAYVTLGVEHLLRRSDDEARKIVDRLMEHTIRGYHADVRDPLFTTFPGLREKYEGPMLEAFTNAYVSVLVGLIRGLRGP